MRFITIFLLGVLFTLFVFGFNIPLLPKFRIQCSLSSHTELFTGIATLMAVVVALFNEPLKEWVKKGTQCIRRSVEIVDLSKIEQSKENQIKVRFKIKNTGLLSDVYKVYILKIVGRENFIEVPLVWLHGYAEGQETTTVKEISSKDYGWVDFVSVYREYYGEKGYFLVLDLGAGVGVKALQLLNKGKNQLVLRIIPKYGKSVDYKVIIDWNGDYSYPDVSYRLI